MKYKKTFLLFIMVFLDQLSKFLFSKYEVKIGNFLSLSYIKNYGAAFGILPGFRVLFIAITFIILFSGFYLIRLQNNRFLNASVLMVLGGGIGNLIDRIFRGYVVDFISFSFFPPIFNLADCFISVGVFLLVLSILSLKSENINYK